MNPFKWAKQQVKQFFDKGHAEKLIKGVQHGAIASVAEAKEMIGHRLTWAERNALRDKAKGRSWFWISTKDVSVTDPKTGEVRKMRRSMTYSARRNAEKRAARGAARIALRKRMWEHSPKQVALSAF